MKIGIIGTRGIPNSYGGFEEFVEFVAPMLVARGHEVYVYNSSLHSYPLDQWKGVHIISQHDPEDKIGTFGQFVYDYNCIMDARKRNYDIILQLGYTSSSVWSFLLPKNCQILTNMDGLEWKRSRYNKLTQRFLQFAEARAVNSSHHLIADSKVIQNYLYRKYNRKAAYIAYGATLFDDPDESYLEHYNLGKEKYNLLIARMEPENNIEMIITGHLKAGCPQKLVIIGSTKTKFGTYLFKKYRHPQIVFMGALYDLPALNNLRYFSNLYFHGHSVGGTNPSLLEAMASNCLIVSHNNVFNWGVLEDQGYYFKNDTEIAELLTRRLCKTDHQSMIAANAEKIRNDYSWTHITDQIENLFENAHAAK